MVCGQVGKLKAGVLQTETHHDLGRHHGLERNSLLLSRIPSTSLWSMKLLLSFCGCNDGERAPGTKG